jgi:hypothetical protein
MQKLLLTIVFLVVLVVGLNHALSDFWKFGPHPVLDPFFAVMPWLQHPGFDPNHRLFWLALGMIPVVYWGITYYQWRSTPGVFRVKAAEGEALLLEPGALIRFARQQVESHPAVVGQKVRVRQSGGRGLSLTANVRVRPIQSLTSIREGLKKLLCDGFVQVMGIQIRPDDIEVIFGLDNSPVGERPGIEGDAEPRPEPPTRAALSPPGPGPAGAIESDRDGDDGEPVGAPGKRLEVGRPAFDDDDDDMDRKD